MTPANVDAALATLSVCAPKLTTPVVAPDRLLIVAPDVVFEISSVPSTPTLKDWSIEPVPDKANVAVGAT